MGFLGSFLGGALGFTVGGPIGAIIGVFLGSAISSNYGEKKKKNTSQNDFKLSLLILIATVLKADGKVTKSELQETKAFLRANFGEEEALEALQMLKNILEQDYDYKSICLQINQGLNYSSKLQLLQILFKISSADTIESSELRLLQTMATLMGISMGDFQSIQAIYSQHQHFHGQVKDTRKELDLAYQILEIDKNASDEEIKKAYRRMAMKYHPDKVSALGDEFKEIATEKFKAVKNAYELIKKEKGFA